MNELDELKAFIDEADRRGDKDYAFAAMQKFEALSSSVPEKSYRERIGLVDAFGPNVGFFEGIGKNAKALVDPETYKKIATEPYAKFPDFKSKEGVEQATDIALSTLPVTGLTSVARKAILKPAVGAEAVKQAELKVAGELGLSLPRRDIKPTVLNNLGERFAGKEATRQVAEIKNAPVFNELTASFLSKTPQGKVLGVNKTTPLTQELLDDIGKESGKAYEAVRGLGQVSTDAAYSRSLDAIARKYTSAGKSFPEAAKNEIQSLVDNLKIKEFDSSSAIDMISILRENAKKAFRSGDAGLGKASREAADVIEDTIGRHLVKTAQHIKRFDSSPTIEVYHGTKASDIFNPAGLTKSADLGPHFSVSRDTAKIFANDLGTPGRIIKGELKPGKIMDMPDLAGWQPFQVSNWLDTNGFTKYKGNENNLGELGSKVLKISEDLARKGIPIGSDTMSDAGTKIVKNWLLSKGYDTVRYKNAFEGKIVDTYIVLNTKNILPSQLAKSNNKTKEIRDLIVNFQSARKTYAKLHAVEDALNPGTGNISAIALGQMQKRGVPLTDELNQIATFARAHRLVAREPTGAPAAGGMLEPLAYSVFGKVTDPTGVGLLASGIPILGKPIARHLMTTIPKQKPPSNLGFVVNRGFLGAGVSMRGDQE